MSIRQEYENAWSPRVSKANRLRILRRLLFRARTDDSEFFPTILRAIKAEEQGQRLWLMKKESATRPVAEAASTRLTPAQRSKLKSTLNNFAGDILEFGYDDAARIRRDYLKFIVKDLESGPSPVMLTQAQRRELMSSLQCFSGDLIEFGYDDAAQIRRDYFRLIVKDLDGSAKNESAVAKLVAGVLAAPRSAKSRLAEMYDMTPAQVAAEKKLNRQGFHFSNWIPASPDAENQPSADMPELGTMVMVRRNGRFGREMREIEPDGTIN